MQKTHCTYSKEDIEGKKREAKMRQNKREESLYPGLESAPIQGTSKSVYSKNEIEQKERITFISLSIMMFDVCLTFSLKL